jgi:hypothetical protein
MILGAFGLSYRQLCLYLDIATGTTGSIRLSDSGTDDLNHNGLMARDAYPIFELCKRVLRSVTNSALLIDLAVLIVLTLCLNQYWTSIMSPNHIHPSSGYALPICWLFESARPINSDYWKNLRVEKQRCMDN